jgi:RNA polymerase sigma factor (sigma-70 family)
VAVEEPQIEQYMKVVRRVARSLRRWLPPDIADLEELEADGFEALVRTVRDYDASKGQLIPYIVLRCRGAMIDGLRRKMLITRTECADSVQEPLVLSLEHILGEDLHIVELIPDPHATTADEVIERVSSAGLLRELTALPQADKRIAFARFIQRRSQKDVAEAEGVSRKTVAQFENRLRGRLQHVAEVADEPLDREPLTAKELTVLRLAAQGATSDETAKRLRKARETVKSQRRAIIAKLSARNIINAVAIGYERGLLH